MAVLTSRPKVAVQNIVFVTDFSPASQRALSYAAAIARHFDAKVHLVHALQPDATDARTMQAAQATLHDYAEECADVDTSEWLLKGSEEEVVDRIVSFDKSDLVVVGTHAAHGYGRAAAEAAVEHFFRHVPCPVMAVGPCVSVCAPDWQPRHVLLATDLETRESAAARCAVFLAREHNARLSLLHVAPPASPPYPADQQLIARPYFQQRLREILAYRPQLEFPAEFCVEFHHDPVSEIVRVAASKQSDLIVLSVHRENPWGFHVVHEAYRIVAESPCPVLITQRKD